MSSGAMSRGGAILFSIPGKPMGKQRPRMTRRGHTYTPTETINYEAVVRERFASENPGYVPCDRAASLSVVAIYPIPKSTPKKIRAAMLDRQIAPTKKPDCDNILKIIADSLNGLAYLDDAQITKAAIEKWYGEAPQVVVSVTFALDRLHERSKP